MQGCRRGEAHACLDGIRQAGAWPDAGIILESDCATVLEKIKSNNHDRSLISGLIHDIKLESSLRGWFNTSKISRGHNQIAHALAQIAMRSRQSKISFAFVPVSVRESVLVDRAAAQNVNLGSVL